MRYGPVYVKSRSGLEIELRNAEVSDAAVMTEYLRATSDETPFLVRQRDEVTVTPEEERLFLQGRIDADRELLLAAFTEGKHIGNCALMRAGKYRRDAHRCAVAIALYQAYCGCGIGRILLETVLHIAKDCGYEQAELEVMARNTKAIALYEKLGFQRCGTLPRNMKYPDGSFDDAFIMIKYL